MTVTFEESCTRLASVDDGLLRFAGDRARDRHLVVRADRLLGYVAEPDVRSVNLLLDGGGVVALRIEPGDGPHTTRSAYETLVETIDAAVADQQQRSDAPR